MDSSHWDGAVLAAILAIIIAYVTGRKQEGSIQDERRKVIIEKIEEIEGKINDLSTKQLTEVQENRLRLLSIEKDLEALKLNNKDYVTAYEMERRVETILIRKDELRRRIVALEKKVHKFDLDGVESPASILIKRNGEN